MLSSNHSAGGGVLNHSTGGMMSIAHTVVTNTLQNTKRKKSTSRLFAKKKPSTNESIQSKLRSLGKLPAIVLSQGRMIKPKGQEQ